ncbi:glycosyltransferase 87 family protein [Amnibacterium flavum]|uniref:DUF2029 domain-containing protein n=1 Tax=Amnibacterium flavum TaxID=2173173 RepID=A0A2V1HN55_9MICO|nr:glycosyltransferase 87 family protein [Amnibacterium flavum]PVZ93915.1 hypothetical protein DDQ50_09075 [Amnibacterium flavum]
MTKPQRSLRSTAAGPIGLWATFLVVHGVLAYINLNDTVHLPFGDVVNVYRFWMDYAVDNGVLVGIDTSWVYPIGALLPMGAAMLFGSAHYGETWLVLVTILDAIAVAVLLSRSRAAAWWWIVFLAALGPVAVARIDGVTAPIALVAVVWLLDRPVVAGVLLGLATWIKIWPAALIGAAILAVRQRARILIGSLAATAVILAAAIAIGGSRGLFSFILEQTGRGLQVEAPISSWWLWGAALHLDGYAVYYDTDILTYQVAGPGTQSLAAVMTPVLVLVVAAIAALVLIALRRGADPVELLIEASFALVLALIVVNKVGSPQFVGWLAAPVVLGILHGRAVSGRRAVAVLVVAVLTQIVYPWAYNGIVLAEPAAVLVLGARNLLFLVLLAQAVGALVRLAAAGRRVVIEPTREDVAQSDPV